MLQMLILALRELSQLGSAKKLGPLGIYGVENKMKRKT